MSSQINPIEQIGKLEPIARDMRKNGNKRNAVEMMRRALVRLKTRKEPKFYKLEIRNMPLFFELLEAGKIRKTKDGRYWETV